MVRRGSCLFERSDGGRYDEIIEDLRAGRIAVRPDTRGAGIGRFSDGWSMRDTGGEMLSDDASCSSLRRIVVVSEAGVHECRSEREDCIRNQHKQGELRCEVFAQVKHSLVTAPAKLDLRHTSMDIDTCQWNCDTPHHSFIRRGGVISSRAGDDLFRESEHFPKVLYM